MLSTLGYYVCVPFAWLVRLFYTLTSSYGLALIFFTLVIKLVMLPFQMKSKKGMIRMSRVSGRMQELQRQYKNNPQRYQMEVQKLYQEEGASPMSGCLWSFIPLPILLALYSIIRQPITHFMMLGEDVVLKAYNAVAATGMNMDQIGELVDGTLKLTPYGQIQLADAVNTVAPEFAQSIDGWFNINYNFLGLNLAAVPSNSFSSFSFQWGVIGLMLIPIVAGLCQFLMTKFMMKTQPSADPAATRTTKSMMYFMPLFSVYLGFIMPAALGLYWIAQSAFSAVQELVLGKFYTKKLQEEEDAREAQRQEQRRLRQEEAKKNAELQRQQAAQVRDSKKIAAKRAEKQERKAKEKPKTNENGRIGDRPYARGRTFSEDHYSDD